MAITPLQYPRFTGQTAYNARGEMYDPATGRIVGFDKQGQMVLLPTKAELDAYEAQHTAAYDQWGKYQTAAQLAILGIGTGGTLAALSGPVAATGAGTAATASTAATGAGTAGAGGGMGTASWLAPLAGQLFNTGANVYGSKQQQRATDQAATLAKQSADEQLAFAREQEAASNARYTEKLNFDRAETARMNAEAKAAWDSQEQRRAPFRQSSEAMLAQLAQKFGLPYTPSQGPSAGPPPGWQPGDPVGSAGEPSPSLSDLVPTPDAMPPQDTLASLAPSSAQPMPAPVNTEVPAWLQQRVQPRPDENLLRLTRYGRRA